MMRNQKFLPLTTSFLPLLLMLLSTTFCNAEQWDEQYQQFTLDGGSVHLPSLYGEIHGRGYLNFADLKFTTSNNNNNNKPVDDHDDSTVEIAVAVLRDDFMTTTRRRFGEEGVLKWIGIGSEGNDGNYYYCCTEHAIQHNACSTNQLDHLIVNTDHLENNELAHLHVTSFPIISSSTSSTTENNNNNGSNKVGRRQDGAIRYFQKTSHMMVLVANCGGSGSATDTNNSKIQVEGSIIWKSYVATNSLPFVLTMTLGHLYLVWWYRNLMKLNSNHGIELEHWIFGILILACVATFLRCILYGLESSLDYEVTWYRMMTDVVSLMKTVASCCLLVLIANGWGILQPATLLSATNSTNATFTNTMLVLAAIWILASIKTLQQQDSGHWDNNNSDAIGTMDKFAMNVSNIMGLVFLLWIPIAMYQTTNVLQLSDDYYKVQRFRSMFQIYAVSMVLLLVLRLLFVWDQNNMDGDGGSSRDMMMIVDVMSLEEGNELIYLVVLACFAHLWKPSLDSGKYGYHSSSSSSSSTYILLMEDDVGSSSSSTFALELTDTTTNNTTPTTTQTMESA